jgi:hypothetical protein
MNENIRMPVDHEWIRNLLREYHRGAVRAICQADLAAETGIRKRRCRKIIKDLIEQFGCPIGSLYTHVGGYFWINTSGETEVTCKKMTDHAIAMLSRVAELKKIALPDLLGQLSIDSVRGEA